MRTRTANQRRDKMESRTIEIIDNHIKALEEELEWYQEKNREWQEKCERLREQLRLHDAKKETIISKLEGKVNVASDLFKSISLWFYKNVGNPDPFWACQFESACKLFENSEEDNAEYYDGRTNT